MRIEGNGRPITSLEAWRKLAGPKRDDQWVVGRSAYECANAWCGSGNICMPEELATLLNSRKETRGLSVDVIFPECKIRFDKLSGEPRNADIAFVGNARGRKVAATIEAKADETFGASVARTMCDALERSLTNSRSRGIARVETLVRALLRPRAGTQLQTGLLRYQLLTAVAGSLAWAEQQHADIAVLIVHEFITNQTHPSRHVSNEADFNCFLARLASGGSTPGAEGPVLHGPLVVPGAPLFENPVPLLIGKVTTDNRS
jgi:hypothetical protein